MRWIVVVIAFCVAVGSVPDSEAAERQPRPLTKLEIRRSPQDQVRRRIIEQVTGALIVPDQSGEKGTTPVRPLEDLWLWTRAYGTATPGLCRSDLLEVTFLPVGPEKGAATPVRAAGLDTARFYRLLRKIHPKETGSLDHSGRVAANAECAAIDVLNTHFIHVIPRYKETAEPFIVEALWQLRRVIALAGREGDLPFELQCVEDLEYEDEQCRKELSGIDPERTLIGISYCPAEERDAPVLPCWDYSARDLEGRPTLDIQIHARSSDDTPDKANKPKPVVRVEKSFVLIEQNLD